MVRLDRIYTRGGDRGETSLGDGSRVAKDSLRVAAYGDIDELNAVLGLAICEAAADAAFVADLSRLQNDLFDLGADLCVPQSSEERAEGEAPRKSRLRIRPDQVTALEAWIDRVNEALPPLTSFILPGGTRLAAQLHVARTVCRRAERAVAALARAETVNPAALEYVNRLSDLLFVLARAANPPGAEPLWQPGGGSSVS
ncbi:cob(I)yrinic acid a,c-diamide adenosyltransferase [Radicibacter daui]|uniref:cob(I)yrinic acid a,c-diamide adenosyltransferase n=1 Tax=Radicibacter daui TaxID=3064829 RepID=UPI004046981E